MWHLGEGWLQDGSSTLWVPKNHPNKIVWNCGGMNLSLKLRMLTFHVDFTLIIEVWSGALASITSSMKTAAKRAVFTTTITYMKSWKNMIKTWIVFIPSRLDCHGTPEFSSTNSPAFTLALSQWLRAAPIWHLPWEQQQHVGSSQNGGAITIVNGFRMTSHIWNGK